MSYQHALTCVAPTGDLCGEAATWSAEENRLYWVDINRFLIHAMDVETATVKSYFFDEPVVALSLTDEAGKLLVALGSRLIFFTPAQNLRTDLEVQLPEHPLVRFNDGRTDPLGHFWIGTMGNNVGPNGEPLDVAPGLGKLYRYRYGHPLEEFETGIGIANTLCWAPDGKTFYFGDTLANEIRAYPFDLKTGTIGRGKPFFSGFDGGLPDGSTIDQDGNLWNCRFFGGRILRIAPDGSLAEEIQMPVKNITTCCFGGPKLSRLYITTASLEKNDSDRLAGSVYALETQTRGRPENRFITKSA